MNTTCIKIEGGLLAPDFLETIADAEGQKPSDFGIEGRRTLVDEVSTLWSDVRSYWDAFQRRLQRPSSESLTTITREQWVSPLLDALGYKLTYHPQGVEIEGRNYRISHRTGETDEDLPVHIEPFDQDLGSRPPSGRGIMSPHAMLQDYLNRTEHLWGIVTNGSTLRLLRDSSYFTRPSYIEFDLRQMLEGERLDEFFLFYRLVHRSRLPKNAEDGPNCLLEKYHQLGIEQGGRIRDGLRNAVEQAIVTFANGFLTHPRNEQLRGNLRSAKLSATDFYQQLLYLIYRLLFLMVAEERGLLSGGDGEHHSACEYFTVQRLRALADEPLSAPERFCDLYLNLRALFYSLCKEEFADALGLPPLNGELFDCARTSALSDAYLNNRDLLTAMHTLSWFVPRDQRVPTRVNYRHLDVEELGSVYESLLDLQPIVEEQGGRLTFRFGTGTERKTTGSYYTRPELVQELIKSALEPVIADRLADAKRMANGEWRTEEERRYACEVISRAGSVAAGHDAGEASLRTDKALPVPGAVRNDIADPPSGEFDPCQHRRGLGQALLSGAHPVHPKGQWQPDGAGDASTPLRGGPARDERSGRATTERVGHSGQATPGPGEESGTPQGDLTAAFKAVPFATRYSLLAERALLSLTVCDPACGSGHFLLAAARRIGTELAKVRTGEEAPPPDAVREAVRDVITHCIYGVDKNPLAVDLCKVALWIEGHSGGKPLTFLDHRLRCGDSLVGVFDLSVLKEGIPDAAFDPVSGDDKAVAKAIKKRNKEERTGQHGFAFDTAAEVHGLVEERRELETLHDDTPEEVHRKRAAWERLQRDGGPLWRERMACHLWTAAFFSELTQEARDGQRIPTTGDLRRFLQNPDAVDARLKGYVWALGDRNRFFHWPAEFPEVFEQGGFDCVVGNPPWVAHAGRAAHPLPERLRRYLIACFAAFAGYRTTHGVFVELAGRLLHHRGALGLVVPSSMSDLDGYACTRRALDSLCRVDEPLREFGEGWFPGVAMPCMALVARRIDDLRAGSEVGERWELGEPLLSGVGLELFERLRRLSPLPAVLFGERGIQTTPELREHIANVDGPQGRFHAPLRQGGDIAEFVCGPPSLYADSHSLAGALRDSRAYAEVAILIRQTARYPIAAASDGKPFLNSLLAAFGSDAYPPGLLLCILNSALIRWYHYHLYRDARQKTMPQVKIGHLRSIPAPPCLEPAVRQSLKTLGEAVSARNDGLSDAERDTLDQLIGAAYGLSETELAVVAHWHTNRPR